MATAEAIASRPRSFNLNEKFFRFEKGNVPVLDVGRRRMTRIENGIARSRGRIGGVQVQHAAASSTRGMTTARNDESSIVPYLSFLCFVFRVQGVKTSRGRGSIGSCSGSR